MGTNKSVFIILGLQTALLLFLAYRVITLEQQVPQPANVNPASETAYTAPAVISAATDNRVHEFVRRDDIRAVMREEMDIIAEKIIEAMDERPQAVQQTPVTTMSSDEATRLQAEITSQISYFSSQANVSPGEFAKLEQSIARLPPALRVKAMSELNRAINNGQIKARF